MAICTCLFLFHCSALEEMEVQLLFGRFSFPTFTFWLLCLICLLTSLNGCPLHERNYLLDVKAAVVETKYSFSKSLDSWQGFNCCSWDGVGCNFATGHVASLDLRRFYLGGHIHSSLFQLAHLQHLDLSENELLSIDHISDVGKLKRLTYLDLSFADAYDNVSISLEYLSNLTSLEYLSLDYVDMSSMKSKEWGEAVGRLSSLRELYMSECGLRGPIPNSLVNLTSLLHLSLSSNSLSAQIPAWFENVTSHLLSLKLSYNDLFGPVPSNLLRSAHQLQQLDLSGNIDLNVGGYLPFIGQHRSLERLRLSNTNIEGDFPLCISNLSRLVDLDLSLNKLTGVIPPSLASNLSSLVYLHLSGNQLTGVIPPSLSSLSSLVSLSLSGNQLNGTIPSSFSELVRLKFLYLHSNSLSGYVSLSLFHSMTRLKRLHLSHNRLTVIINSSWNPPFEKLLSLGLSSCNLVAIPSFLVNQYYLEYLHLSLNSLAIDIPTWIWDLPNLYRPNLSSNKLTGSLPSRLTSESLLYLDLRNNSLKGVLPLPPPRVLMLDLSMNQFNASIPFDFGAHLEDASFLSLSGNNLSGGIPNSVCGTYMQVLDLSKNMLSNKIPHNFTGKCSYLSVLNLAANHLEGEMPEEWGNLEQLHTLNLNGNHLEGVVPSSISKFYSLQVLDLGNNNLEGTIPNWIGNLLELQIIMLRSNRFQGNIPVEIISLSNLQILDLSHNKLSGSIPSNLTNLLAMVNASQSDSEYLQESGSIKLYTNQITVSWKGWDLEFLKILSILKCIDLSNNSLSGVIPPKMGSLQGLISLNLSRNYLSGQIPKALGGMSQLESLDISVNRLNGTIPLELEALNYLQVLNLSYNMLVGRVPLGGQFLTFEEPSYLGNVNLSGIPFSNTTWRNSSHDHISTNRDTSVDEAEDSEDGEMKWWALPVAVGLSYGVGFSVVIGVLTFNKRVRKIVFALYDGIILAMLKRR